MLLYHRLMTLMQRMDRTGCLGADTEADAVPKRIATARAIFDFEDIILSPCLCGEASSKRFYRYLDWPTGKVNVAS